MHPHRFPLLFAVVLIAAVSVRLAGATSRRPDALVGGYRPIKNLSDPHIIEIAKFAVSEHNRQEGSKLQFVSVVKGESQVVAGINYRLIIAATDGTNSRDYEAVVYEKPWEKYLSLISFKSVNS